MKNLFLFFNTDRRLLLSAALLLAISVGAWVSASNAKLKTAEALCKIVSLQLTSSDHNADLIVESWRKIDVINIAEISIVQDYFFILTYVLSLILLVMALDKPQAINRITIIASWLAVVAGLADVVENIFVTMLLHGSKVSALTFFIPAVIKYSLLGLLLGYLIVQFFRLGIYKQIRWGNATGIGHGLKSARMYMPGLITVLISYFLFSKLPQGQDVIIQITEFFGPFIWAICCAPVWAVFCWYSSRLVGYEKSLQPGSDVPEEYHTHVPRIIAYNSLVSIQAAILALPTIGHLEQGAIWAFIVVQNTLYFFRHKVLTIDPVPVGYRYLSWIIMGAYGILTAWLAIADGPPHAHLLPIFAYGLFIFQMILMYLFIKRRKTISRTQTSYDSVGYLTLFKRNLIDVPESVVQSEQPVFVRVLIAFVIGFVIYSIAIFVPYLADHMGPMAIVVLSFGVLVVISNVVTIVSIQRGVNLFVVLFIWAIILGNIFNPYSVRRISMKDCDSTVTRPMMKNYVEKWLRKREAMIDASETFPVYLVIADGGASRSGYWVASVLSAIQEETEKTNPGNAFSEHLLVLAGASGGSVGNGTFYALLKNNLKDTVSYQRSSQGFLAEDFLSPVLTRWLGSDFFKHIIPMPIDDRAIALEKGMEYFSREHLNDAFSKPFSRMIDTTGCLPILFINTTNVQQGAPAVISSVGIDSISERIDVLKYLSQTYPEEMPDLKFSTAVVMGARFPFVSPAGNIANKSFVDGGYFDNTGAGILHEMMQNLAKNMKKNSVMITNDSARNKKLLDKLRFQLIYLRNSSLDTTTSKVMHPLVNDLAAPIITVLGTYGSQTNINNSRLKNFMASLDYAKPSIDMNLYRSTHEEEFPMNWVISNYNLERMNNNLADAMNKEFTKQFAKIDSVPPSALCNCRKLK